MSTQMSLTSPLTILNKTRGKMHMREPEPPCPVKTGKEHFHAPFRFLLPCVADIVYIIRFPDGKRKVKIDIKPIAGGDQLSHWIFACFAKQLSARALFDIHVHAFSV